MKSPEYVAIVVSTYRRALDAAAPGSFVPDGPAVRDLMLAFNRGIYPGLPFWRPRREAHGEGPANNRGVCIGTVSRYDRPKGTATVRRSAGHPASRGRAPFFHPDHPSAAWGSHLTANLS